MLTIEINDSPHDCSEMLGNFFLEGDWFYEIGDNVRIMYPINHKTLEEVKELNMKMGFEND